MRPIPIPIPIYYGHGHIDSDTLFALWIVINGLTLLSYSGITIAYFVEKPYYSWFWAIVWETTLGVATTSIFCLINFIALIVFLTGIVKSSL